MSSFLKQFVLGFSVVASLSSFAQVSSGGPLSVGDLTIAEVHVEELSSTQSLVRRSDYMLPSLNRSSLITPRVLDENSATPGDNEEVVVVDQIINVGKKIWKLIEAGKPVVNVNMQSASALPQGINTWEQMEGWQAPQVRVYRIYAKNLYGMTVIDFSYRVLFIAGGSYKGKGQYLARVAVQPENLDVAWGYSFEAEASVPSVTNAGTQANPVAGAEVLVKWKINTIVKSNEGSGSYYVKGNGTFNELE